MALQKIGFEGQTPGTTVTLANSSAFGDSQFSTVSVASGAAATYANDWAAHGTNSLKVANAIAGSTAIFAYAFTATPAIAQRVYFRFDTLPTTSSNNLMQFRHSPDSSAQGVTLTTTGLLSVSSAESSAAKYQGTYVLLPNTNYRLEGGETLGGAGTGRMWTKLYLADSTTPITGASYDSGNTLTNNTIQANFGSARMGKLTNTAAMGTLWFDDWAVQTGSDAAIGPVSTFTSNVHAGSGLASAAYVGNAAVSRMYLGATQLFG